MSLRTVAERHLHPGRAHDVRRADRLGGVDVLLHDGPEDGGLAFVEHVVGGQTRRPGWHSMLPSASPNGRLPEDPPMASLGPVRFVVVGQEPSAGSWAAASSQHGHEVAPGRPWRPSAGHGGRRPAGAHPRRGGPGPPAGGGPRRRARPRSGDVVLLAVKSQDTAAARRASRGTCRSPASERRGQRAGGAPPGSSTSDAVPVMLPALDLVPGVVDASSAPTTGILDVGRYPPGRRRDRRARRRGVRRVDASARSPGPTSCASVVEAGDDRARLEAAAGRASAGPAARLGLLPPPSRRTARSPARRSSC